MRPPFASLVLWLSLAPLASGDVINVPGDFPTIQAAIDAASDLDEIVVAPATYFERINFLGKPITVRSSGGSAVTTIDGSRIGTVVEMDSGEGRDTVLEGFTVTGGLGQEGGGITILTSSPTVRDCIILGNDSLGTGAGAYVGFSNALFENCLFQGNVATGRGGGVYSDQGTPEFNDCTFGSNIAVEGGGGYSAAGGAPIMNDCFFDSNQSPLRGGGMTLAATSAVMTNVDFRRNLAQTGGAVETVGAGRPEFHGCTFDRNRSLCEAGAFFIDASDPELFDCIFTLNQTTEKGGAVSTFGEANPVFSNGHFENNTVSGAGGAIYFDGGTALVLSCEFVTNDATAAGGAVRTFDTTATFRMCSFVDNNADAGGAVVVSDGRAPEFLGCDFVDNSARASGGAILATNTFRVAQCMFSGNRAETDGGAIFIDDADVVVEDSILYGNGSSGNGGAIACSGGEPTLGGLTFFNNTAALGGALSVTGGVVQTRTAILWGNLPDQISHTGGTLFVRHCDVEGGWPGLANIDADPLWVDPKNGDFHLLDGSPCIDAGSTEDYGESLVADPPLIDLLPAGGTVNFTLRAGRSRRDFDFNERFVDITGVPEDPPKPDLGAFEWGAAPAKSFVYLLAGSATGTDPGFTIGGLNIPLVPDTYLELTLDPADDIFIAFRGNITGQASATLAVPPGLGGLAGLVLFHAFVSIDGIGALAGVSSAEPTFLQ